MGRPAYTEASSKWWGIVSSASSLARRPNSKRPHFEVFSVYTFYRYYPISPSRKKQSAADHLSQHADKGVGATTKELHFTLLIAQKKKCFIDLQIVAIYFFANEILRANHYVR